jgi:hypothetical protein
MQRRYYERWVGVTVEGIGSGLMLTDYICRWGSGSNSLEFLVPPIDAITSFAGSSATVTSSLSNDLNAGVDAARGKDVAFVFVNA